MLFNLEFYFDRFVGSFRGVKERELVEIIQREFPEYHLENPNQSHHQENYRLWKEELGNGMKYYFDIVLPTTESVSVTESVLRVACGGENYVRVARVANLGNAIDRAKKMGFWIIGTVVEGARSLCESPLRFPLGLVMGSEEKGVRDVIRKRLDLEVMIPMKNLRMSLNVAHATSMVCYEIIRQKK